ncbi:MAG: hypothetical protein V4754_14125 [Pseudomonadota bacterium]
MKTRLRCPVCENVGTFSIQASVNVNVNGKNGFIPFEESERWFGSESPCTCAACAYLDTMAAFVTAGYISCGDEEQWEDDEPGVLIRKPQARPRMRCPVYPFPGARKKEQ